MYKTAGYIARQDQGWSKKDKQAKSTKKLGKKILAKKVEEGFKDQFEPEYSEAKRRLGNKIRAKVGMKKKPALDWKKARFGKTSLAYESKLPPHLAKFINPKTGNLKAKYEKRISKPPSSAREPVTSFTVKDVTPKGYGPRNEDAASGRPIKKPVTKVKKKDSGKDGSFVFSSPKSNVIGSYELRNKIGAKLGLKPITAKTGVSETAEYKAAMGPGSHEWGTDIGRDYFKKLTPGQDNPPEDPIKPLNIKAKKPEDYKGVKVTEEEAFNLDSIVAKQAEYSKEKYPEDNEINAQWQSNVDGILTGAYEGGKITWEDVLALDKEAEDITFDQEVDMGLYDDDELEQDDFDGDPLNDIEIMEVLSVQGRMKRRFAARRNRQRLKVSRSIALRRGSTPDRLKRRATRGARLMVYKRLLRGRDRSKLPPAEKARLEGMIKKFQPLVNRIAVKLQPQIRKNEIKRMAARGKKSATASKKYKAAKPIRGAASAKAKRFKIKKQTKYKQPKAKKFKSAHRSGGPTLKKKSKAYKAFSYSVG